MYGKLLRGKRLSYLDDIFCSCQELFIYAEAVLLYSGSQTPLGLRGVLLIEGGQCTEGPYNLRQLRSGCQDLHAPYHNTSVHGCLS